MNTVVGVRAQPTIETIVPADSTDTVSPANEEFGQLRPTAPHGMGHRLWSHLRDSPGSVFVTIAILALSALFLFTWENYRLASALNRELGELKATSVGMSQRIESTLEKLDRRVTRYEERFNSFIENMVRDGKSTPAQKTKR